MNSTLWFTVGALTASAIASVVLIILWQSAARIVRRKQAVIEFLSRELSKERMANVMRDRVLNGGIERIERN